MSPVALLDDGVAATACTVGGLIGFRRVSRAQRPQDRDEQADEWLDDVQRPSWVAEWRSCSLAGAMLLPARAWTGPEEVSMHVRWPG